MTDITQIVTLVIALCVAIITAFLVPYLKKKYGQEKINDALNQVELIKNYAKIAVNAVEQMFPGQAEKRLQEATDYFNKQMEKLGITLDEDEVRKAIEAAVLELNNSLKDTNTTSVVPVIDVNGSVPSTDTKS